jgi:hypothetical protein
VRDEAVIARIEHCGVKKAIHEHRARRFVEFVFDWNAANRNFYNGM